MIAASELEAFGATARRLALEGGAAILGSAARDRQPASKGARRDLVTAADAAAERIVVGGLLREFPAHAILAEEGALTPRGRASSASEFVWVVDPLDGTTNFVHGLPYYCVAIGLVHRGEPVVGVVHAPELGATYHAVRGGGAFRNDVPIAVSDTAELADALLATGFSYVRDEPGRDDNTGRLRRALHRCRDVRRYGSAQLDFCLTAAGAVDAFWEVYLQPWDVAAGTAILREAGGKVTDLVGGADWLHGENVLATNAALHDELLEVVGGRLP
jgi:myo-inositol-1(or 4)-monophosphatase